MKTLRSVHRHGGRQEEVEKPVYTVADYYPNVSQYCTSDEFGNIMDAQAAAEAAKAAAEAAAASAAKACECADRACQCAVQAEEAAHEAQQAIDTVKNAQAAAENAAGSAQLSAEAAQDAAESVQGVVEQATAEADRATAEAEKACACADAAKVSENNAAESATKAEEVYEAFAKAAVYRGIWNPQTGEYPDPKGTNSYWDVVLAEGDASADYDGKTWHPGDRLIYSSVEAKYHHVPFPGGAAGGVISVNGKTGAVTITADSLNAYTKDQTYSQEEVDELFGSVGKDKKKFSTTYNNTSGTIALMEIEISYNDTSINNKLELSVVGGGLNRRDSTSMGFFKAEGITGEGSYMKSSWYSSKEVDLVTVLGFNYRMVAPPSGRASVRFYVYLGTGSTGDITITDCSVEDPTKWKGISGVSVKYHPGNLKPPEVPSGGALIKLNPIDFTPPGGDSGGGDEPESSGAQLLIQKFENTSGAYKMMEVVVEHNSTTSVVNRFDVELVGSGLEYIGDADSFYKVCVEHGSGGYLYGEMYTSENAGLISASRGHLIQTFSRSGVNRTILYVTLSIGASGHVRVTDYASNDPSKFSGIKSVSLYYPTYSTPITGPGYSGPVSIPMTNYTTDTYTKAEIDEKVGSGGAGGGGTFVGLKDTPATIEAGKMLVGNSGGTALEFVDVPTGGGGSAPIFVENSESAPKWFVFDLEGANATKTEVYVNLIAEGVGINVNTPMCGANARLSVSVNSKVSGSAKAVMTQSDSTGVTAISSYAVYIKSMPNYGYRVCFLVGAYALTEVRLILSKAVPTKLKSHSIVPAPLADWQSYVHVPVKMVALA